MGWVYFIQVIGPEHPIKIGYSRKDPRKRMRDLQTGSPYDLELLFAISGASELDLHKRFRKDRIRGEWFRASKSLEAFIRKERDGIEVEHEEEDEQPASGGGTHRSIGRGEAPQDRIRQPMLNLGKRPKNRKCGGYCTKEVGVPKWFTCSRLSSNDIERWVSETIIEMSNHPGKYVSDSSVIQRLSDTLLDDGRLSEHQWELAKVIVKRNRHLISVPEMMISFVFEK